MYDGNAMMMTDVVAAPRCLIDPRDRFRSSWLPRRDLSVCNHRVGRQGLLLAYFNAPVERGGYYFCGFAAVRENWRLGESFAMDGADGQVTLRSICHSEGVRNSSVDEGLSPD